LAYQKARLAPKSYERISGIVALRLKPFFQGKLANIRRVHVQRYVTERSGKASNGSIGKEVVALKHLLRLAIEWEIIPINTLERLDSFIDAIAGKHITYKELTA
jgi:hypothetical protein